MQMRQLQMQQQQQQMMARSVVQGLDALSNFKANE